MRYSTTTLMVIGGSRVIGSRDNLPHRGPEWGNLHGRKSVSCKFTISVQIYSVRDIYRGRLSKVDSKMPKSNTVNSLVPILSVCDTIVNELCSTENWHCTMVLCVNRDQYEPTTLYICTLAVK